MYNIHFYYNIFGISHLIMKLRYWCFLIYLVQAFPIFGRNVNSESNLLLYDKRDVKPNENMACIGDECGAGTGSGTSAGTPDQLLPGRSSNSSKQKASSIAQKAAQEAKAASDAQAVAGQQAAHQVKSQLAEKALQAAKAAEAALAGL